jgi:Arc/MetJ-type ribon-helix-helix transcriptional regulator
MRAGLSLLEAEEAGLAVLRDALAEGEAAEGEASATSAPFDFEAFVARKRGGDASNP